MHDVALIDHGLSNINSIARALKLAGGSVRLVREPAELVDIERVVLPGVGAFGAAMQRLEDSGLSDALKDYAQQGKLLLGICLGMQLLCERSDEEGHFTGLGLIPGHVRHLSQRGAMRVPHIGWNNIQYNSHSTLLQGIPDGTDFYFVHSYFVDCDAGYRLANVDYAGGVAAIINHGNIYGAQFHPEKSQQMGIKLLKNFLELPPC